MLRLGSTDTSPPIGGEFITMTISANDDNELEVEVEVEESDRKAAVRRSV
jgi:hypothetical protein